MEAVLDAIREELAEARAKVARLEGLLAHAEWTESGKPELAELVGQMAERFGLSVTSNGDGEGHHVPGEATAFGLPAGEPEPPEPEPEPDPDPDPADVEDAERTAGIEHAPPSTVPVRPPGQAEALVLAYLRDHGEVESPKVRELLGYKTRTSATSLLSRMHAEGSLARREKVPGAHRKGHIYSLPGSAPVPPEPTPPPSAPPTPPIGSRGSDRQRTEDAAKLRQRAVDYIRGHGGRTTTQLADQLLGSATSSAVGRMGEALRVLEQEGKVRHVAGKGTTKHWHQPEGAAPWAPVEGDATGHTGMSRPVTELEKDIVKAVASGPLTIAGIALKTKRPRGALNTPCHSLVQRGAMVQVEGDPIRFGLAK